MKDQSVPARWRVLGIINGFLINGLDCYASNEWFMDKLGCTSEQTISNAFKELEEAGEILCTRTRTSRKVTRRLNDPNQLGSRPQPVRVSDPNQLGSNAPSIASNIMVAEATRITYEEDTDTHKRKKKVTPEMQSVFDLFYWNPDRYTWKLYESERLAAKVLYDTYGIEKLRSRLAAAREQKQTRDIALSIHSPAAFLKKMIALEEQQQQR